MIERADPSTLACSGTEADLRRHIESDFRIRSGLCPNGCGLMTVCIFGQECPACGFMCNTQAERVPTQ